MSGGAACTCKPKDQSAWYVAQRKCNHSKFNGLRYTPSLYSEIWCARCLSGWRTKAPYVDRLPDLPPGVLSRQDLHDKVIK